ncbi:MAG: TIGR03943 family protein [Cyanobacteria bacterium P01_H01_bin.15]
MGRYSFSTLKFSRSWLELLALGLWGALLLKYYFSGQLYLLIHPNYFFLVLGAGILLTGLVLLRGFWLLQSKGKSAPAAAEKHVNILPTMLASAILLLSAVSGFLIPPKVLASQAALQRGVADTLPLTKTQASSFRSTQAPEERTLLDWVRTLNAYPEPDAYLGQRAQVQGFVIHPAELGDDYLLLARFILTCCAVDAYPVALPIKLPESRANYPADTWLKIKAVAIAENLPRLNEPGTERQLVLEATEIEVLPTPSDPYAFNDL